MANGQFAGQSTLPSYLQPTQGKNLYAGNYLDFFNLSGGGQWAQQFLPDVYDKEIEIYGNRTISGFLKMVSAEMPSSSDQIIWLEQGRLHTRYAGIHGAASTATATLAAIAAGANLATGALDAGDYVNFDIRSQGGPTNSTSTTEGDDACNFRIGQTVMIQAEGTSAAARGDVFKGVVTAVSGNFFKVRVYKHPGTVGTGTTYTALVYGSEFAKGTGNFTEKIDPSYSTYQNSPIIMKEHYAINGSDTGQIGWIEVTSENGASGYLWYVKAEHENRLRWEDYQEMAMVEGVQAGTPGTGLVNSLQEFRSDFGGGTTANQTARGTQGFFDALETRGNVYDSLSTELVAGTGGNGTSTGFFASGNQGLGAFDSILRQMDKQGSIEENMLYVDRDLSLAFTDMLAAVSSTGNAMGTSYGIFNNSEDMALKLHFNGFRRGSYDFYQTDWKYLNDFSTRGGFSDIEGVLIPAGTSTVYDQNLGKNIKRPFLHVRYRASETDNRKMKSWITGSVGGAFTTDVDEMRMHYLTERCLITQGANNFYLFKE